MGIYFDTDSIDVNAKYNIVLGNRGCGQREYIRRTLTKLFMNRLYGMNVTKGVQMTDLEKSLWEVLYQQELKDFYHDLIWRIANVGLNKKEEKKMTNRDAVKEFFGLEPEADMCFGSFDRNYKCGSMGHSCEECKYKGRNWLNAEYKAPKRIVRRKVKYFSNLTKAMEFLKENNIAEKDVFRISKTEGLSVYDWCVQYDEVEYKVEEKK